MSIDYAERARALVGTRFRPQGRDPNGLDCVGVIVEIFAIEPAKVRRDYKLSGDHGREVFATLKPYFRKASVAQLRRGDLLVMAVTDRQTHLAVRTDQGFVHAHAGLRRVVETPGLPEWPVIGAFRRRVRLPRR